MKLHNLSFKVQINLSIFFLVILTLLLGFSYSLITSYGYQKNSFINESKIEAGLVANHAIAPILFMDKEGLENSLEYLKQNKSILQVQVFLEDGLLFGQYKHNNYKRTVKGVIDKQKESWFVSDGVKSKNSFNANSYVVKEPLILNDEYYGVLYLEKDVSSLKKFLTEALTDMLIFSLVLLILMGAIIYKVSKQLIYPIVELSDSLEYLSQTKEYGTKLEYNSTNEIGKLYSSFNVLMQSINKHEKELQRFTVELESRVEERTKELVTSLNTLKKAQTQLVESEKMASLGALVSGVAHEVNTPLGNAITGSSIIKQETAELLKSMNDGTMKKSYLESTLISLNETARLLFKSVDSAASLIRSFKKISVDQSIEDKRDFDIVEYTKEVIQTFNSKLKQIPVKVIIESPNTLMINSYPGVFAQLLNNLIQNAIIHAFEFKKENAIITIKLNLDDGVFELSFSDNGAGMDEEMKKKAFDPFVTTKRNAGGTGLGLNITYNLVTQKLKGTLELETKETKGSKFTVYIPV
ncbi:GHKL domain-containing protein [Sulfurimonas sp. SAG-AH-194-C21]|nr:sensor histidine kinase [Sulfurimonas sp. SAG-AH-194-C21]MDF1883866.1 GHKL domain-containing protein [Sulfurimonas sp. SAG-AH-194-C21]